MIAAAVDAVVPRASGRACSRHLIRLVGDFDLAEEACRRRSRAPSRVGARGRPRASRARGSCGSRATRRSTVCAGARASRDKAARARVEAASSPCGEPRRGDRRGRGGAVADDRLRLIFTCCHPALARRGAGRADAAHAVRPDDRGDRARVPRAGATMAQRLVRAKTKIRDARDPVRGAARRRSCPSALDAVMAVVYLVFNEGYAATRRRRAGAARAVRRGDPARPLARELMPAPPRRPTACSR